MEIECVATVQSEYKLGQPVIICGSLTNRGPVPVWLRKWNTFLEPIRQDYMRVSRNSIPVAYDGRTVVRSRPSRSDYILLGPGESAAEYIDVTEAYTIDETGDYNVYFDLLIGDAFEDFAETGASPERATLSVRSNPVVLHVLPGSAPRPTVAAMLRSAAGVTGAASAVRPSAELVDDAPNPLPTTPLEPVLIGFDDSDEMTEARQAHYDGYSFVLAAYYALSNPSPASRENYRCYFGAPDKARFSSVVKNFYSIGTLMAQQVITYRRGSNKPPSGQPPCGNGEWAFVAAGTYHTVYICDPFYSWLESSDADRGATVVHEVGHMCGLKDIEQDSWQLGTLARRHPELAVQNAASYGLFAQDADGEVPQNNGIWQENPTLLPDATNNRTAAAAKAGVAMLMYQDNNTSNPYLWFHPLDLTTMSGADSGTILNTTTNDKCKTAYGPAVAALPVGFYCVYVDGDPNSPLYKQLVYVSSSDWGTSWVQPQSMNLGITTSMSPALTATFNHNLCCAFVDAQNHIQVTNGTVATDGSVAWSVPAPVRDPPVKSMVEPGLGALLDTIYLAYGSSDGAVQITSSTDGVNWSKPEKQPLSHMSGGVAFGVMYAYSQDSETHIVGLYRGPNEDTHLRYIARGASGGWSLEWEEATNTTLYGPALVSEQGQLYAFYRTGDSSEPRIHFALASKRAGA